MSRCFPYPPPGYLLSRDREEALIESIKLQEEKRKKKEKKERRREGKEKKEKRKEKREKRKHKKHQNSDKSDIVKGHNGQNISSDETEFLHKRREAEAEAEAEAERSSLTEEHGDHVSLSGPTYSSDRTQNSNKRKRNSSPKDESHSQSQVILIRMPSKRQNEFDTLAKEQQACSTSGRTDGDMGNIPSTLKGKNGIKPIPNKVMSSASGRTDNEMGNNQSTLKSKNGIKPVPNVVTSSTSGRTDNNMGNIPSTSKSKNGIKPETNGVVSSMQRMEMQYKNLLDKLVPQVLQDESLYSDNLDWLFKNQDSQAEKRQRSGSERVSSCSRSSAEFLHETGVFVLPYTVPY